MRKRRRRTRSATFATLMIESDKVPWSDIAKLLGHKDPSTLTEVYGHLRKTVPITNQALSG